MSLEAHDDTPLLPKPERENLVEPENAEERSFRNKFLCFLLVNLIVIVALYMIYGKVFFSWLLEKLKQIIAADSVCSYFLIMAMQIPFGAILFLPGIAFYNIVQAFLLKNFLLSFTLSFVGGLIVAISVVIVIRLWFIDTIHKKFRHFLPYQMLIEETREHPLRDGIIFNFIFFPQSVKNYIIAISELELWQAAVAFTPALAVKCLIFAMIGSQVSDISELSSGRAFSEKTRSEKMKFVATIVLIILSFILLVIIGIYYKRKYAEFIERRAQMEERLREENGQAAAQL